MSDDDADKTDDVKERLEDSDTMGSTADSDSDVVATLDNEDGDDE